MPCLRLLSTVRPARRAWKGLSSAVKNALDRLARTSTTAFRSLLQRARSLPGGCRGEVEFESWTRMAVARRCMREPPPCTRRFELVYVGELVGGQGSCLVPAPAEKGPGPGPIKMDPKTGSWKGPVMAWEVDERAAEFIEMFRVDMRLEREKSIEDFEEMLARGAR